MWPYSELGIEPTADERAIKRAYAARLRHNRPDEHPEGFQRLNEAYREALARCADGDRPATRSGLPQPAVRPPGPVPARIEAPPPFDLGGFIAEASLRAGQGDAAALRAWLDSLEALWSLDLKARVGRAWLASLRPDGPPMPRACLDELLAFFHLGEAGSVHDPLALEQLRRHLHMAWYLAPEQREALAQALEMTSAQQRRHLQQTLHRLQQPFRWSRALLRALTPGEVERVGGLLGRLAGQPPMPLPPPIEPRQVAFWTEAGRQRLFFNRIRLAVTGARSLAILLAALAFGLLLATLSALGGDGFRWMLPGMTLAIGGLLCLLSLAMHAWGEITAWQCQPAGRTGWAARLQWALVPSLAVGGVVLGHVAPWPGAGWWLAVPALWLGVARFLSSWRSKQGFNRIVLRIALFLAYPLAHLVGDAFGHAVDLGDLLALLALLAWSADAWRRRSPRRRAFA